MQHFEKNIISKSRSKRKHITEFHKTTKDVRKQVSLDVKQITVTQIVYQVVITGALLSKNFNPPTTTTTTTNTPT